MVKKNNKSDNTSKLQTITTDAAHNKDDNKQHIHTSNTKKQTTRDTSHLSDSMILEITYNEIDMVCNVFQMNNKIAHRGFRVGKIPTSLIYQQNKHPINRHAIYVKLYDICNKDGKKIVDFDYQIFANSANENNIFKTNVTYQYILEKQDENTKKNNKEQQATKINNKKDENIKTK